VSNPNRQRRALLEVLGGALCLAAAAWLGAPKPAPGLPFKPSTNVARPKAERERPLRRTASYTLTARLDTTRHRISGKGSILFVNSSQRPVNSLFFHLYLNAFKNDRTLFLRSPFGAGRSGAHAKEFGYVDVKTLTAREFVGVDLWATRARHSPHDPEDETDIEVPLPSPVPPDGQLTLDIEFESQLPEIVERTGYAGSFHFMGQWFPKLARLESDGTFAHFAFHPQAEFYADYGHYDVTLEVPASYVVGASGVLREETRQGELKRLRYEADAVHDFAWTAWDRFVEYREQIGAVAVRVLMPPGFASSAASTLDLLRFALPHFSERFGSYPYPTLTVVHPPSKAGAAGGMEYPTLITTGGPWYAPYSGMRGLEAVTIHELGHEWFYGLLASNEAKWPFLDEGLNSYAELSSLAARYGDGSSFDAFGLKLGEAALFRSFSALRGADEPVASEAQEFSSFRNLGALVYSRTATLLETIARVWGRQRLDRALFEYAERHRFSTPEPADLLSAVREFVTPEAATFLELGLFRRGTVDYVVREVENATQTPPAGYFERGSGREKVLPTPGSQNEYISRVTVYRHGSLEVPVEVLLIAANGQRTLEHWDGRGAFHIFERRGASPLAYAVVDPDYRIVIDDNLFNNRAARSDAVLPRVHERLAYAAALLLGGVGP
jgi:hypothetical protein